MRKLDGDEVGRFIGKAVVRRTAAERFSPKARRIRRRAESRSAYRTAEAIVPASSPMIAIPGVARRRTTDVAASRCRHGDGRPSGARRRKRLSPDHRRLLEPTAFSVRSARRLDRCLTPTASGLIAGAAHCH